MLHSRTLNYETNHLHERALKFVHCNYKSSFETFLKKDGSVYHGNIQSLVIATHNFLHGLSLTVMGNVIKFNRYARNNLRTRKELCS